MSYGDEALEDRVPLTLDATLYEDMALPPFTPADHVILSYPDEGVGLGPAAQ